MAAGGTAPAASRPAPSRPVAPTTRRRSAARCSPAISTCGSTVRSPTTSRRATPSIRRHRSRRDARSTSSPNEQLTPDDIDTSTDLYMWSAGDRTRSRWSRAIRQQRRTGNSDSCNGGLDATRHVTTKCGVATYTQWFYCSEPRIERGAATASPTTHRRQERRHLLLLAGAARRHPRDREPGKPLRLPQRPVQYVTTLTGNPTCFNAYST